MGDHTQSQHGRQIQKHHKLVWNITLWCRHVQTPTNADLSDETTAAHFMENTVHTRRSVTHYKRRYCKTSPIRHLVVSLTRCHSRVSWRHHGGRLTFVLHHCVSWYETTEPASHHLPAYATKCKRDCFHNIVTDRGRWGARRVQLERTLRDTLNSLSRKLYNSRKEFSAFRR